MVKVYGSRLSQKLPECLHFIGPMLLKNCSNFCDLLGQYFSNYGAILFDLKIHEDWIKEKMIENREGRTEMRPCY